MQQLKYASMTLTVEVVGKEDADAWLAKNHTNRNLRKGYVNQYARDMVNGKWREKPIAICFLPDGALGNGQHTLTAISRTGCAQTLLIARNVPKSVIAVMDRGATRTVPDVAKFTGDNIGPRTAALAKILCHGPGHTGTISFDEVLCMYASHKDVIDFVESQGQPSKGVSASVLAVCARAAYTRDRVRIAEFMEVLHTGIGGPEDSAAIRLRDTTRSASGRSGQVEMYAKTQSALAYYLDRLPMQKIYGTTKELFPIPGKAA